jgi:hypothetical protein
MKSDPCKLFQPNEIHLGRCGFAAERVRAAIGVLGFSYPLGFS